MGSDDRRHRHDGGVLLLFGIGDVAGVHRRHGCRLLVIEERLLTMQRQARLKVRLEVSL